MMFTDMPRKILTKKNIIENLISWRMVENILPSKEEFLNALYSGKRLRFYWGIDPTSPDVHLGHLTNFWFLRDMQRLGHEIIILVGDFTARIGDPSGRDAARKPLSAKEVKANAATYKAQLAKIVSFERDKNPALLVFNSKWLSKLSLEEVLRVASHLTVKQLLEREMFERRMKKGEPVWLHEFIYPLLQGYDSLELEPDVEVGGEDQLFNMLIGRKLLEELKGKQKFVITTKLLINPATGKKLMSKSEGNYVSLRDKPDDMYGKVMSFSDELVWPCLELATDIPSEEILKLRERAASGGRSIRDVKAYLAEKIVSRFYSIDSARKARDSFEHVFVKDLLPSRIPIVLLGAGKISLAELLKKHGGIASKSEAVRLIKAGAVKINGKVVRDWKTPLDFVQDAVVKIGKRKFLKVRVKQ